LLTRESEKKAQKQAAKEAQSAKVQAEKERHEFLASPIGQARTAHEARDMFFQFVAPLSETRRTVMAVLGGSKDMKRPKPHTLTSWAESNERAGGLMMSATSSNRPAQ
jgi:hypothetical protein